MDNKTVLLLEPFYCGSHKQLIDLLHAELTDSELFSLPGKKWHWKARTSALYFSQTVPRENTFRVLFASSVLNLAELVALRPDLGHCRKVLYFHENQLVYPVRKQQDRDFQYGYNQIISCMAADKVVFSSRYNMESFLSSINTFLKLIPDHRPKGIPDIIRPKCCVLNFPIKFPPPEVASKNRNKEKNTDKADHRLCQPCDAENICCETNAECLNSKISVTTCNKRLRTTDCAGIQESQGSELNLDTSVYGELSVKSRSPDVDMDTTESGPKNKDFYVTTDSHCSDTESKIYSVDTIRDVETGVKQEKPLHIVWPHRWEHDKGPESFFKIMFELVDLDLQFQISVLGEQFSDVPEVFTEAKKKLGARILHWGYQETKEDYFDILRQADCVVSTALHEFFGVAMLEAVSCGCYPLCPNRLVYPEIFSGEYLYNTDNQLFKKLKQLCKRPALCRDHHLKINTQQYSWETLKDSYKNLLTPGYNLSNHSFTSH